MGKKANLNNQIHKSENKSYQNNKNKMFDSKNQRNSQKTISATEFDSDCEESFTTKEHSTLLLDEKIVDNFVNNHNYLLDNDITKNSNGDSNNNNSDLTSSDRNILINSDDDFDKKFNSIFTHYSISRYGNTYDSNDDNLYNSQITISKENLNSSINENSQNNDEIISKFYNSNTHDDSQIINQSQDTRNQHKKQTFLTKNITKNEKNNAINKKIIYFALNNTIKDQNESKNNRIDEEETLKNKKEDSIFRHDNIIKKINGFVFTEFKKQLEQIIEKHFLEKVKNFKILRKKKIFCQTTVTKTKNDYLNQLIKKPFLEILKDEKDISEGKDNNDFENKDKDKDIEKYELLETILNLSNEPELKDFLKMSFEEFYNNNFIENQLYLKYHEKILGHFFMNIDYVETVNDYFKNLIKKIQKNDI